MTDRDWKSAAQRLGVPETAGLSEVIHTLLDRIEALEPKKPASAGKGPKAKP